MDKGKTTILMGLMFVLLVASQCTIVEAHSPGPMTLEYNMDTDILTVTVTHVTADVNSHYVYEIVVLKNSIQVDIESYTSQSDSSQVIETFAIAAEDGDVLSVTAKCSVAGQVTEEITVGDTTPTTTASNGAMDSTILMLLVATAIVAIGVILVIVLVVKRR